MEIKTITSIQVFGTVAEVRNVTRAAQLPDTGQSAVSDHVDGLSTPMAGRR